MTLRHVYHLVQQSHVHDATRRITVCSLLKRYLKDAPYPVKSESAKALYNVIKGDGDPSEVLNNLFVGDEHALKGMAGLVKSVDEDTAVTSIEFLSMFVEHIPGGRDCVIHSGARAELEEAKNDEVFRSPRVRKAIDSALASLMMNER
jgi:hypothetical protein